MIGKLKGSIDLIGSGYLIVDVSGVGYKVNVSSGVLADSKIGDEVRIYIHTHVREDQLALFGFNSNEELGFFELLISVSGIGPKAAMHIMSIAPIDVIKNSISKQDPSLLSSASGIGRKTAEKIVVELKNKIGVLKEGNVFEKGEETDEVISALEGLGYKSSEIRPVLAKVSGEDTEDRIKEALKLLSK